MIWNQCYLLGKWEIVAHKTSTPTFILHYTYICIHIGVMVKSWVMEPHRRMVTNSHHNWFPWHGMLVRSTYVGAWGAPSLYHVVSSSPGWRCPEQMQVLHASPGPVCDGVKTFWIPLLWKRPARNHGLIGNLRIFGTIRWGCLRFRWARITATTYHLVRCFSHYLPIQASIYGGFCNISLRSD